MLLGNLNFDVADSQIRTELQMRGRQGEKQQSAGGTVSHVLLSAPLSANPSAPNDRVRVHVCVSDLEQFSLAVGQLEQQLQQVQGE